MQFSYYKGYIKWDVQPVGVAFKYYCQSMEEKRLDCKICHIEHQNDFWSKMPTIDVLFKICEHWTEVHFHIVKLESIGQQPPIIKENSPEIVLSRG